MRASNGSTILLSTASSPRGRRTSRRDSGPALGMRADARFQDIVRAYVADDAPRR
jgi:hypothetical protein